LALLGCNGGASNAGTGAGTGGVALMGSGGAAPVGSGGTTSPGTGGIPATGTGGSGSGGISPVGAGGAGSAGVPVTGTGGAGSGGMNVAGMGGSDIPSGPPTFARVWEQILVRKSCNSAFCHGMAAGNLSMRNKDDAYMNLVNAHAAGPKCGTSGLIRVVPNDPMNSLLLDKISSPMPPCGDPMPIGTKFAPNCLANTPEVCDTASEATLVRDWIAAGAQND
jgi:hypothetical protein